MQKTAGVILVAALVAVTLSGPSAIAHSGLGGIIQNLGTAGYLEGESYSSIAPDCDPAPDGDHTLVSPRDITDIEDVSAAVIPYSHCAIAWWDAKWEAALEFTKFRVRADPIDGLPYDHVQNFLVRMWIDDGWTNTNLVAEGVATLSAADGYVVFPFTETNLAPVTWSYGTIKFQAIPMTDTPNDADLWVDWIEYNGACLNRAPFLDDIRLDGMVDGLLGWAGVDALTLEPYRYTVDLVGVTDPDGDPYEIIVEWSDGMVTTITDDQYLNGTTSVIRSFDLSDPASLLPEEISFIITILDEPLRCIENIVSAVFRSLPLDFIAVPDLVPELLSPLLGFSCHDGTLATTWTQSGLDTIYGSCPTSATTTFAGFPPGYVSGDLRIGSIPFHTDTSTDLLARYDATQFTEGFQDLKACFYVPTDKYDRDFCSAPFQFENKHCINTLPTVIAIEGDGMVDGLHAWLGMDYTLTAQVHDREGDPVDVEWVWEDQPSDFGPTATRAFIEPGGHPFALRLTEDVSGRCADAPTEEVVIYGNMVTVVEDWLPRLQFPREGMSCIGDRYVPTWLGVEQDIMAASCNVSGAVDIAAPGMDPVVKGSFLLDGETIWSGTSSAISATYNSLRYATEEKTLSACFEAEGDKYGRVFCSAPFEFLNVGF